MWPLLRHALPKSGINRNFPQALLYGPSKLQGLGVKNPYIHQGTMRMAACVEHSWKHSMTGHFISTSLEFLRLELGLNINIFLENYTKFEHLLFTQSWVRDCWRFASENKIQWNDGTAKIPMRQINDIPIMAAILAMNIPTHEQRQCNKCRIYLKAFTLADLVTGDGTKITTASWTLQSQNSRNLIWPIWGKPSYSDIMTWRKVLRIVFCPQTHLKLPTPLGSWVIEDEGWEWYLNREKTKLFCHKGPQWVQYKRSGRDCRYPRFDMRTEGRTSEPNDLHRTTVQRCNNHLVSSGYTSNEVKNSGNKPQEDYRKWLFYEVKTTKSIWKVIEDLRKGTAVAVSDGSFIDRTKVGAASWIIESADRTEYVRGLCLVPGPKAVQSAYRSELVGLMAIMDKLRLWSETYNIQEGGCTLACD